MIFIELFIFVILVGCFLRVEGEEGICWFYSLGDLKILWVYFVGSGIIGMIKMFKMIVSFVRRDDINYMWVKYGKLWYY